MSIMDLALPNIKQLKPFPRELSDLPVEEIKKQLNLEHVYKLSFNENLLGPSPSAVEAMQKAALEVNTYPSSYGDELCQALAEFYGVKPSNLLLSNGADEMINLVAQSFAGPGDAVVFPTPSFGAYGAATRLVGANPLSVELTEHTVDLDALLVKAKDNDVKIVYICNPNNPTGTMVYPEDIEKFMQCISPNVIVIIDEAYMEFTKEPDRLTAVNLLDRYPNLGVIRTFSKIYGLAGARVGYLLAGEEIIHTVHRVRPPFNVNGMAQAGALAALKDRDHVEKTRQFNQKQRCYLESELVAMDLNCIPSCSNFLCLDTGKDSQVIFTELAKRGIIVRPGFHFGMDTFLRVSIGNWEANQIFAKTLKEIIYD